MRKAASLASAGLLAALVAAVFLQVHDFELVSYDDPAVITRNPEVLAGLTPAGVRWAFTADYFTHYWQPLTWISHQLDVTLFGFDPGRFHLVNVALHGLNAILLLAVMRGFTGAGLPSLFTAALFAVHPLHVESVAWVTERRDVLSALFFLLALLAYRRYLGRRRPAPYAALLACGLLGVMAKPMVVTLPLTLLVLDYWPGGRLRPGSWRAPLLEKAPLFAVAAGAAGLTYVLNLDWARESYPVGIRVGNAFLSVVRYLQKTAWPADLAYFYPHPGYALSFGKAALAALAVLAVTAAACTLARRRPAIAAGWAWFLGGLLPVLGLVQAGRQGYGDHFTYLPLIGLFIALSWGLPQALPDGRAWRSAIRLLAVVAVVILAAAAWRQTGFWRNSILLTRHATEVTPDNWVAHNDYGRALLAEGRPRDARQHFQEALRINPGSSASMYNSLLVEGLLLQEAGRAEAALDVYRRLEGSFPEEPEVLVRLGYLLSATGRPQEAVAVYERLRAAAPANPLFSYNLAVNLARAGRAGEAMQRYRDTIRLDPRHSRARANLAAMLLAEGRLEEAVVEFREALRLDPGDVIAAAGLGQALLRQGRRTEAVAVYRSALERSPGDARLADLLARALGDRIEP